MPLTKKCCIKGCSTYATMGIPMHHFHTEEVLLFKWLDALKDANITQISVHTVICGLHFKLSDYKNRRLKSDAVPSQHLSHDHILNDLEFSDQEIVEEEVDSVNIATDATVQDNTSERLEEFSETTKELFIENDVNDGASDVQKLMSLKTSVNENIMCFALETLEEGIEAVDDDHVNTLDKEVQTNVSTVDIGVQSNCKTADIGVHTKAYSFMDFLKTDKDLHAFTGIKYNTLHALLESAKLLIIKKESDKHLCTLEERIILTLCKLKLDLSFQCLAVLFQISKQSACNHFEATIHLLACILEEAIHFPDKEEIEQNLPTCFYKFKDTRIILDCTEIAVHNSKCLQCRLKMYSHYKGRQTFKILIGITPSGLISYCSKCYGGRASDKSIFLQSGLLEKMIPGQDAIMVDKGFMIQSECDERKLKLIRPPFADKTSQMTQEESLRTRKIAAARVHVERSIQRLKNFHILKSTVQWDMTKHFDEIMIVICGLVNLSSPILDKCRF